MEITVEKLSDTHNMLLFMHDKNFVLKEQDKLVKLSNEIHLINLKLIDLERAKATTTEEYITLRQRYARLTTLIDSL